MQAARGASLSDADTEVHPTGPTRALRLVFIAVAVILYGADQLTKALATAHLTPGEPRNLVGSLLRLDLTRNAGAAFSTGTGYTELFSCLAIVAVLVVLWLSRRIRSVAWAVAFGLLLAGIAGNLTDRLLREPGPLRGHVVDFLMLPSWPVFNVADIAINVAAALILVQVFRGVRLDGTRVERGTDEPGTPAS